MNRATTLLLNGAHALDHLVLLIFASAVGTIAAEFGIARWEDLMPYAVGAFIMFGLGAIPSGRLGDLWGRRKMMLVFFAGIAFSCIAASLARNTWQMAIALTMLGAFASIYHPVGIPMLLRHAAQPGRVIGWNNLAGNMGLAIAAILTGFMVQYFGWRMAFLLPAALSVLMGIMFARVAPTEAEPPGKKSATIKSIPPHITARALLVVTVTSTTGSLLFNFTTNGNNELLRERFVDIMTDPALLGMLLACVYAVAAFSQVAVGYLMDHVRMKPLYLGIIAAQVLLLALAVHAQGWILFACVIGYMTAIFGAIPFIDAVTVRYVDDRMRSRVTGIRLATSFGVSSMAVFLLGPIVKASGFETLLAVMAIIACGTAFTVYWLPKDINSRSVIIPHP